MDFNTILRTSVRTTAAAAIAGALAAPAAAQTVTLTDSSATVLRGEGETDLPLAVSQEVRTRAGRLVYNAYPTGVAVS